MARQPRLHVPGGIYHAILRGNHRQVIFHSPGDYRVFESILRDALERHDARVHAYCWMPNHVHLAVQVGEPPLGRLMHLLASRYARAKQKSLGTTGHLFERRYRAKQVAADQYLLALVRYIHRNPERAGLVADPAEYPWSSHRAYLGRADMAWLTTAPTLAMLGPHREAALLAYRRFMGEAPTGDEVARILPGSPGARAACRANPLALDLAIPPASAGCPRTLEQVLIEVAGEVGVSPAELASRCRRSDLSQARAEVARRALREGIGTLSQVSARLGRAPSSLSELLARYRAVR